MATFQSYAFMGGVPFRSVYEHPFEVTASVLIPSGTGLAAADVIKFFKLGANVRILDIVLACDDLDTGTAITLDLGYDLASGTDDDNAFIDNSTVGQAGGIVSVSNGGDDPFAVGILAPQTETMNVQAKVEVAPTASPATNRYITCTARCQMVTAAPSGTPYTYGA